MKNIDLATIKLDFDALADYWWTDDNGESFPILCCLNLYEACGLLPYIEAHAADHPGFQVVPLDNIQNIIFNTAIKYETNNIELIGSKKYINGIVNKIREIEIAQYNEEKLNITIISG